MPKKIVLSNLKTEARERENTDMTRVTINPGVCNLLTTVEADSEDQMAVTIKVKSGCQLYTPKKLVSRIKKLC